MSEFEKDNALNEGGQEALNESTAPNESSIFDDPLTHKQARIKGTGAKVKVAVSLVLILAILAASIFIVFKYMGNDDDTPPTEEKKQIEVVDLSSDKISVVNLTNKNGVFNLYWKLVKDQDETEQKLWCVEGIDSNLTSSVAIEYVVSNAAKIYASRIISGRTEAQCGLDDPRIKIDVVASDNNSYSLSLGDASLDKTGTYLKVSGDDNIYLVSNQYAEYFDFTSLDLADTSAIKGVEYDSTCATYFDDEKMLETFDSITVSSKKLKNDIVIVPNKNEEQSDIIPFLISSPQNRYAGNVDSLINSFINGITAIGAYSYDLSEASLKKAGLDDPDVVFTLKAGTITKTYKIAIVNEQDCAIIDEDKKMIKMVSLGTVPAAEYKETQFYSDWIFMDMLAQISSFDATIGEKSYKFGVTYDPTASENADKFTVVGNGGKMISSSYFQSFYQFVLGVKTTDFEVKDISASPNLKIKLTFSSDYSSKEYAFYKVSDTKYQYSVNGEMQGKISATNFNKLVKNIKLISENQRISG